MSKQKQQNNIRIHQVNNFENASQMKQYADAQTMKLQASDKELTQVKGISQGGQNALQNFILQRKTIASKTSKKPNVDSPRGKKINSGQFLIESFKTMQLQKFQIAFQDQVLQSQSPPQVFQNQEFGQQNIIQESLIVNKIGRQFKRKEVKKLQSPLKLIQQKDQSQLELLYHQKKSEMEQLQQLFETEIQNQKAQEDMLQQKNNQITQYLPIFEQQISSISQQVEQESQNLKKKQSNEDIQKRIEVLVKKYQKLQYEIIKIDLTFDKEVESLDNRLNQIGQQINNKILENQQYQSLQNYDQSRKVISRQHNFEQFKSSQINSQLEDQIQALRQEHQRLEQERKEKFNQSLEQQDQLKIEQGKLRQIISKYQEHILNNNAKEENQSKPNNVIEENLKKKKNELFKFNIQLQVLKQESSNLQKQMQQNKEDSDIKTLNIKNQINSIKNQMSEITEQIKTLQNQKLPKINQKQVRTQYRTTIHHNSQNIDELIESYLSNSLSLNLKTKDEIFYQEQTNNEDQKKIIMILEMYNMSYVISNKTTQLPLKTKWITQDILYASDLLKDDQAFIEQSQQEFLYLTSDQVNGFAELLSIKEQAFYFRLPKKIRSIYPRLYIFPSCFLEEYRLNYKQNIDFCIELILSQLEDFQAIQYQFQLIYQKIAFIIQEDTLYYVVTVQLNQRVVIIYNSIPKPQQYYIEIQLCLNHFFSLLLKERVQFEIHVSPIFPNQFNNSNDIFSGYYACIALDYYSKNQVNKNFLQIQEIKPQIHKIKLQKNISSYHLRRKQLE